VTSAEACIENRLDHLPRVAALLDELAAAHGLPRDAVVDMQVALDEVLTNVITHGYADDGVHEIRVRVSVVPGVLEATVEDDARPFDPLTIPPPDLSASLRERAVGGLGIHFVRTLMSEVTYARVDNRNRLVLKKRLTR
jgi:serine/threonine-protein kinase RsbW